MEKRKKYTLDQINLEAAKLKSERNLEGVIKLAESVGLSEWHAEQYLMGNTPSLTTQKELALAKVCHESVDLDLRQSAVLTGILSIVNRTVRKDADLQKAVLSDKKSLLGCVGQVLRILNTAKSELPDEISAVSGLTTIQDLPEWAVEQAIKMYYLGEQNDLGTSVVEWTKFVILRGRFDE